MLQVDFAYPVNGRMLKIVATCKTVTETALIGLTLNFFDKDDNKIKVEFDTEMFQDIEDEASVMLSDIYYNPEVSFGHH